MRKWLRRLVVATAIGGVVAALVRRRRAGFDPTRPSHDWGTNSLAIDEAEVPPGAP